MKKNLLVIVGVVIVIIVNALAFAQRYTGEKSTFEVDTANQTFERLQKNLMTQHDYNSIVSYVQKIEELQANAKKCVEDSEYHLKIVGELLKSSQVDAATQLQRADLQYLQGKQVYHTKQLSECRLLVYRSHETLANYKNMMQTMSENQILQRSTPIWKLHERDAWAAIEGISTDKIIKQSGIALISGNQWLSCIILLVVFGAVAFYIRAILKRTLLIADKAHPMWHSFLYVLSDFIVPSAIFGVFSIFLNTLYQEMAQAPTLELMSHATLLLTLAMAVARALFYPSKECSGLFSLPPEYGRRFYSRILFLLWLLFFGYLVSVAVRDQPLSTQLVELSRTFYLTWMSAVTAWVFFLWYRSPYANRFHHGSLAFFSTVFIFALGILVLLEWLGYHHLAVFAIQGLCLTIIFSVIVLALWRLTDVLYQWVDNTQYSSARSVHQWFGVKINKKMHEIVLVKFAVHFTVLCLYFVFLLKSWSFSSVFVDTIVDGLLFGFKFLGLNIIPLRVVLACVTFAVVFLAGRLLSETFSNKQEFKGEENVQLAISTITIYISFGIAFLFAMFVTGVDFTGLAIIAGALSVGVGMGLQSIVNNFVSGLILLLEKPIKPGDRIVIGKTEGFVRKIRIRSTQISTLAKEDVIVPNADFMTQQVTNCMFRDRYSRVSCQVGVAYGTDVHLVKKLLLEMASKHAEVVQEAPNAPIVLFTRFGESSLIFDLWCVIYDVNKKYLVVSDLNFAIDAAFRDNKIVIAFPQREIHIKHEKIE